MTKFCKDCKHLAASFYFTDAGPTSSCNHPDMADIVTGGGTDPRYNRTAYGKCGPDGLLWEAKLSPVKSAGGEK